MRNSPDGDDGAPDRGGSAARAEFVRAAVEYLLGERELQRAEGRRTSAARGGAASHEPARPSADALGIRVVAELTGRSHAAPLFHFPDRTTLVAAVAADGFRRVAAALIDASRADRDRLAVLGVALRYVRWAGDAPALFATMYDPALARPLELMMTAGSDADALAALHERYEGDARAMRRRLEAFRELLQAKAATLQAFLDAVVAGQAAGALRNDVDPGTITHAIASMADGLAWQRVTELQGSAALLDWHAETSLTLLLNGIGALR